MIIKKPGKGHPNYRLLTRKEGVRGYRAVNPPELAAINQEFREGRLSFARAEVAIRELRDRLAPVKVKTLSWLPENQAIALEYWEKEGSRRRLKAPQAAKDRILLAVKRLGSQNLLGDPAAIEKHLRGYLANNQQRSAIQVINSLRKFKRLPAMLIAPPATLPVPEYLTKEEIAACIKACPRKEWALMVAAAYGTGCRKGELYAIGRDSLKDGGSHVLVEWQYKRGWVKASTKNNRKGVAFVLPWLRTPLKEWVLVPTEIKKAIQKADSVGRWFSSYCQKELRRDLSFHNLRHSYARYMLGEGARLEEIAAWLRDRMSTVERYYLAWEQTNAEMASNKRRFG